MPTEQQQFKQKLEQEMLVLVKDLKSVGRINPENPGDWEALPANQDLQQADPNEMGDKFEQYEENTAILKQLETRYNEVKKALDKFNSGKGFGLCETCGKEIESDRLAANPAAATCKVHMS